MASAPGPSAAAVNCPPEPHAPTSQALHAAARNARDHGFLWRAEKDGRLVWLYGTLHVGSLETAWPGPTVAAALRGSDVLALEIDLLDPAMQRRLASSMAAAERADAAPLPGPLAARLQAQIDAACVPAAGLQSLSPILQVLTLETLSVRRDGLDPAYGVDAILGSLAHEAHQRVVSLETPEAQIGLLTDFSADEERRLVEQTLDELETGRARPLLLRTARVWLQSRHDELESYAQWCECMRDDDERRFMKRLLDERNVVMADAIEALHAGSTRVFVAVGSLHMIGREGLPALLAQRGYTVERIAFRRAQNEPRASAPTTRKEETTP